MVRIAEDEHRRDREVGVCAPSWRMLRSSRTSSVATAPGGRADGHDGSLIHINGSGPHFDPMVGLHHPPTVVSVKLHLIDGTFELFRAYGRRTRAWRPTGPTSTPHGAHRDVGAAGAV